ncbi:TPA: restriction endonuclease subunit S [Vibrio vulnificus]|nr:restriction endonuclease subunit S [Vibrio vulnificus]HAS8519828.1 restriction endonuclease subunit S [Vibrio vulnificus]
MSCSWPEFTIDELKAPTKGAIAMGPFGSRIKAENFVDSGVPVLKGGNLHGAYINDTDCDFLTEEKADELKSSVVYEGDIVITHRGTIGQVSIVSDESKYPRYVVSQSQLKISLDKTKVNPYYVNYYLRSRLGQHQLLSFASQVGVPAIAKASTSVKQIRVPCPPLTVQEKIVDFIRVIDRKHTNNSSLNQTLEQMAQAIFKSWFVDFDPVKAKMNGEQPEGMDAATASLFPEKLVESELGFIPEGWEVGTLDSHTSMIIDHRGKTPKKLGSDWVEEGYPAISAKNIKSKKIVRPDTIRFIDEATYKKWMKEPLIKGDIIMTSEAPMGELYFFDGSEDFCLSQRLYGLRANSDVCSPEFLFNWLQTTKAKADMEGRASGTTALGIKQAELRKVKILTPPLELLEKYSAVASNLVDMAAKNNAQNTVLEDLRDTLLPKLLSGEIELGETNPESIKEDV